MQVEFFVGSNPKSLQDKINAWLKEQGKIIIHLIVQTQETGTKGALSAILITLWYSDITNLPAGGGRGIIPGRIIPGFRHPEQS